MQIQNQLLCLILCGNTPCYFPFESPTFTVPSVHFFSLSGLAETRQGATHKCELSTAAPQSLVPITCKWTDDGPVIKMAYCSKCFSNSKNPWSRSGKGHYNFKRIWVGDSMVNLLYDLCKTGWISSIGRNAVLINKGSYCLSITLNPDLLTQVIQMIVWWEI